MGRRERLERRIEKRRDWAVRAEGRSQRDFNLSQSLVANIPMGQPILVGHHSEKAHRRVLDRSWNALGRSVAETRLAERHESVADNLEVHLERSIFSDDDNAIEALEARIAEMEAQRERMKTINKLYKKNDAEGLAKMGLTLETLKAKLAAAGGYWGGAPHLPYELSNLGQRIQKDKKRIEQIRSQKAQLASAADEGGVKIERHDGGWASVTFAEKPERSILNDLKAAGFHWSNPSWYGQAANLPQSVIEMRESELENALV